MKTLKFITGLAVSMLLSISAFAAVPRLINYQGLLTNSSGDPLTDSTYSVTFTIYDIESGGSNLWTENQNVSTADGLFTVNLGAVSVIPDSLFSDTSRYLGIQVNPNAEFSPRSRLVSSAYSFRVGTVDGASGGNINSKVSIGPGHTNTGVDAFVAGVNNVATGDSSTIGGGSNNKARGKYSVVGGGGGPANPPFFSDSNSAIGDWSTISGGGRNIASGEGATVSGGETNIANGNVATVGGGFNNEANGVYSTVPGGRDNIALGEDSFAAGQNAEALHDHSFVWSDGSFGDFVSTADNQFLIGASGRVGIGTNSPNEKLTVAGSMEVGTSAGDYQHLRIGGGNSSGFLYGSYPFYGDGINIGYNFYADAASTHRINFGGSTSRLSLGYGEIGMYVGTLDANAYPSLLAIYINGFGNVGIGTAPSYKLDVAGQAHASTFLSSSDIRLKKNFQPLTNVLEKIEKIRGVSFDWNETYEKMGRSTGHREIGVITQEVEKAFPELITTWGDEKYRAVDYGRLSAVLIEAVKELNKKSTEVDELKTRVGELEKAIKKLLTKNETSAQTYTPNQELKGGK